MAAPKIPPRPDDLAAAYRVATSSDGHARRDGLAGLIDRTG
jgi:hypothetical protein